ncbi:MAG: aminodeoxychorismate lyase [Desulfobacterales bacterium CG23_combo_of_CG06-09_8_20_14_all_51_8]|nr:MAG: aminodeoxychorismate lyase [Desulfobacterales bacterium CG23_combo_of_CG06-09_8_20_14_all_51_8]
MKKQWLVFGCLGLIMIALPAYFCADLYFFAHRPAAGTHDGSKVIFKISPGQSFHQIADHLFLQNLISSTAKFRLLAHIQKADRKIIAGEYELSMTMTPIAVLKTLTDGSVRQLRLFIPEGLTLQQIAERVTAAGFCDSQAFMDAAGDESLVRKMGINAKTFEGFLFPDTYHFTGDVSPEKIIKAMVARFREAFPPKWENRAQKMGFSVLEIVTLASMIEKETGVAEERPVVSSVFHNRLKQKMHLASDPTVIYGLADFDGNLTRTDLTTLTPYNTYMIAGLPPGPIANPGASSLHAALFPARTDYLYFVAKKDGTHYFSTTLEEHTRAVQEYQLKR